MTTHNTFTYHTTALAEREAEVRKEEYTKGYNAGMADATGKPLLAIEQKLVNHVDTLIAEREAEERERILEWLGSHTVWDNEYVYMRKARMMQAFREHFLSDSK